MLEYDNEFIRKIQDAGTVIKTVKMTEIEEPVPADFPEPYVMVKRKAEAEQMVKEGYDKMWPPMAYLVKETSKYRIVKYGFESYYALKLEGANLIKIQFLGEW